MPTSTTYVALLRAVNVGGLLVPMATLRELAEALGWTRVSTHLASGNLLLRADVPAATVATTLSAALLGEFAREIPVVVRTPAQLATVLERARPTFPDAAAGRVHVAFLDRDPGADADERLGSFTPDEHVHVGRELVLHYPTGQARTKLTTSIIERRLGVVATVRGLRTIEGVLARAVGLDEPETDR